MNADEARKVLKGIRVDNDDEFHAIKMAREALANISDPLNDSEQRIFLAAMKREEIICKGVDEEYKELSDGIALVPICKEVERKVKKALWT